jgi:hypothetical protein
MRNRAARWAGSSLDLHSLEQQLDEGNEAPWWCGGVPTPGTAKSKCAVRGTALGADGRRLDRASNTRGCSHDAGGRT